VLVIALAITVCWPWIGQLSATHDWQGPPLPGPKLGTGLAWPSRAKQPSPSSSFRLLFDTKSIARQRLVPAADGSTMPRRPLTVAPTMSPFRQISSDDLRHRHMDHPPLGDLSAAEVATRRSALPRPMAAASR